MSDLPANPSAASAEFERILSVVAAAFGVTRAQIMSHERFRHIAAARHVTIYLARELLGWSYPFLGTQMNHKDHTSCMHAHRRIIAAVKDPGSDLGERTRSLRKRLGDRSPVVRATELPGLYAPEREKAS